MVIKAAADVTAGEREGMPGKSAEEKVRAASQSVFSSDGEAGSAQSHTRVPETCKKQDVELNTANQHRAQNRQDQESNEAPVDSATAAEEVPDNLIQNEEHTTQRDGNSCDQAEENTRACNMYDDEIWEIPAGVL